MKATIASVHFIGSLVWGLLILLCLQAIAPTASAQLISGDNFESYAVSPGSPQRLQSIAGSVVWTSSTTANVVDDSAFAYQGEQFVTVTGTAGSAKRTFSSIPTEGTYYIEFALYNHFSKSTLDNGTTSTTDDGNVQVRLNDGTTNLLSLQFRGRNSTIELAASGIFYDTGISYDTALWRKFTFAINLLTSSTATVDLYVDGTRVLSNISMTGFDTTLTTLDLRTAFLAGSPTDSVSLDDIGFYSTYPVPEPGLNKLIGAAVLFVGTGMALRKRQVAK